MSTPPAGSMSIVEHIVLFKVKPDAAEEKKIAMVRELNALQSLDGVLHLRAGPALQLWPSHRRLSDGFTHVLHSRYSDKAGLAAYTIHPSHIAVVENFVKPIAEDVLAMDWEAWIAAAPIGHGFGAKRVVACKLREESEAAMEAVLDRLAGKSPASSGLNFSPGRAKGFNFGLLSLAGSVGELDDPETLEASVCGGGSSQVESLIVLDYVGEDGEDVGGSAKM